ncbi:ADP-ribose glycohydrolase MACROD1 isoform X2 [Ambystoma mexicanum]|uniref:ADP-ribose glycohydrolase MACROD1 isoform X2 n=1 Tax=Ambystoma mexicanum TaxID=8296 RepID=UPI0037E8BEF5
MSPHWIFVTLCRISSVRVLPFGGRQGLVANYGGSRQARNVRDVIGGAARVSTPWYRRIPAFFEAYSAARVQASQLGSSASAMAGKGGRGELSGLGWKEARAYLKGLSSKQRQEHYSMRDFIRLKQIPTWKDMAKSAKLKPSAEVKYPKDKHLIEKISLFKGDITKLEVDAIVNADQFKDDG